MTENLTKVCDYVKRKRDEAAEAVLIALGSGCKFTPIINTLNDRIRNLKHIVFAFYEMDVITKGDYDQIADALDEYSSNAEHVLTDVANSLLDGGPFDE